MIYTKYFESVNDALNATDLVSPNATFVTENDKSKYLMIDCGLDTKVEITGTSIDDLEIVKKEPVYVDLGLPSSKLWMKYNLGVNPKQLTTAEDWYGKYYQFGDTVGYNGDTAKAHSTWSTCPFNDGATSYNSSYFLANKSNWFNEYTLKYEYDAINIEYEGWHAPTKDDCTELINNTTSTHITNYQGISGLNGCIFTANNKSLFIPSAGYCDNNELVGVGEYGFIWSGNICTDSQDCAYQLTFNNEYIDPRNTNLRNMSIMMRGVK